MKITDSQRLRDSSGFTIIELMISTAVFSVVLLITSAGIIAIGHNYYKSLTSNKVHESTRSLMNDISGSLQFSDNSDVNSQLSDPDHTGVLVRCFGSDRYRYFINQPVTGTLHQGIYRDKRPSDATCNGCNSAGLQMNGINCVTPDDFTGAQQLLGNNMRLLQFDVSGSDPYQIAVRVAYGDNDLLTTYDIHGNPLSPPLNDPTTALCRPGNGNSFCAVSSLVTTVTSRVK